MSVTEKTTKIIKCDQCYKELNQIPDNTFRVGEWDIQSSMIANLTVKIKGYYCPDRVDFCNECLTELLEKIMKEIKLRKC